MKKNLKLLHLLNLDVVAGAVIGHIMFAKLPNRYGEINLPTVVVLGACTWIIYIIDRFLDNLKPTDNQTIRHSFHAKYRKQLGVLVLCLVLLCIGLLFFLPKSVFYLGFWMLIPLLAYFFWFFYFKIDFVKEFATAIFYTIAIAGTALINHNEIRQNDYLLALNLGLIAFQNLLLFSLFENYNTPSKQNIVTKFGSKWTLFLMLSITIFIILSEPLFFKNINYYQSICYICQILMTIILLIISFLPKVFLPNENYRWLADLVFLLPFLICFELI
jgi:hypothetical protein